MSTQPGSRPPDGPPSGPPRMARPMAGTPGIGGPAGRSPGASGRAATTPRTAPAPASGRSSPGWAEGGPVRVRLTPTLVLLGVSLGAAGSFILWGLLSRDAEQVPLLVSGLLVMAVVLGIVAAVAARGTYRAARAGYAGRAFALAVVGGSVAVTACVALAGASVLALIWVS